MKRLAKSILYWLTPRWTTAFMSARQRSHGQKMIASWGNGPLGGKLLVRFGSGVQEGPFAGLTLTAMTHAEQIGPYLLGLYESELDEAWETVFRGDYPQIIDIGAKFGYYAVGLAKRYPRASVVAFDTDWWARRAIREMADANLTSNVEVRGFCSRPWLEQHLQESALIVSDCEGYENFLFGSLPAPRTRTATLLIETHDAVVPGVSDRLREAFGSTHTVHTYDDEQIRRISTRPLGDLSESELQLATQEVRDPQTWLLCLPNTGSNCLPRRKEKSGAASPTSPD